MTSSLNDEQDFTQTSFVIKRKACIVKGGQAVIYERVFFQTLTEGFSLDEGTAFLHHSFGFLKSVFGAFLGCFHQLLHLGQHKIKMLHSPQKLALINIENNSESFRNLVDIPA